MNHRPDAEGVVPDLQQRVSRMHTLTRNSACRCVVIKEAQLTRGTFMSRIRVQIRAHGRDRRVPNVILSHVSMQPLTPVSRKGQLNPVAGQGPALAPYRYSLRTKIILRHPSGIDSPRSLRIPRGRLLVAFACISNGLN